MLLAVAFTFGVLIDWTGEGGPRGLLVFVPALCGIVGAVIAALWRPVEAPMRALWAMASFVVGVGIVPAVMALVLYVSGP